MDNFPTSKEEGIPLSEVLDQFSDRITNGAYDASSMILLVEIQILLSIALPSLLQKWEEISDCGSSTTRWLVTDSMPLNEDLSDELREDCISLCPSIVLPVIPTVIDGINTEEENEIDNNETSKTRKRRRSSVFPKEQIQQPETNNPENNAMSDKGIVKKRKRTRSGRVATQVKYSDDDMDGDLSPRSRTKNQNNENDDYQLALSLSQECISNSRRSLRTRSKRVRYNFDNDNDDDDDDYFEERSKRTESSRKRKRDAIMDNNEEEQILEQKHITRSGRISKPPTFALTPSFNNSTKRRTTAMRKVTPSIKSSPPLKRKTRSSNSNNILTQGSSLPSTSMLLSSPVSKRSLRSRRNKHTSYNEDEIMKEVMKVEEERKIPFRRSSRHKTRQSTRLREEEDGENEPVYESVANDYEKGLIDESDETIIAENQQTQNSEEYKEDQQQLSQGEEDELGENQHAQQEEEEKQEQEYELGEKQQKQEEEYREEEEQNQINTEPESTDQQKPQIQNDTISENQIQSGLKLWEPIHIPGDLIIKLRLICEDGQKEEELEEKQCTKDDVSNEAEDVPCNNSPIDNQQFKDVAYEISNDNDDNQMSVDENEGDSSDDEWCP
eukprot:TRINITY_DN3642_c2_g2_i1.p1 TRINITY_DN3642_c2_g2~~TRINITY_DN3642_c2_g2_i1.p1  ORF type:complete len:638 (-),score=215.50 TRINITY_DN3642_c2_g2_i1:77-1912(-)